MRRAELAMSGSSYSLSSCSPIKYTPLCSPDARIGSDSGEKQKSPRSLPNAGSSYSTKTSEPLFALVNRVAGLAVAGLLERVRRAGLLVHEVLRRRDQRGGLRLPAGLVALGGLLRRQELVGRQQLLVIVVRALARRDLLEQRIVALVQGHDFLHRLGSVLGRRRADGQDCEREHGRDGHAIDHAAVLLWVHQPQVIYTRARGSSVYFARSAFQSRDRSPTSVLPVIVSPLILPLYFTTTFSPLRSRVTWNFTSPSLKLASSIAISLPSRPVSVPVSLSPSSFSLSVDSIFSPLRSKLHFDVPSGLASSAAAAAQAAIAIHSAAVLMSFSSNGNPQTERISNRILFLRCRGLQVPKNGPGAMTGG